MALSVEAAELMEEFQWLTGKESQKLSSAKLSNVKDELADIFNYLLRICSKLDIDLIAAAEQKIVKNAVKYPISKSRGNAKKYTELL